MAHKVIRSMSRLLCPRRDPFSKRLLSALFNKTTCLRPMHFFGVFGLLFTGIGFLINLYLAILWFMKGGIGFRPLLMLGILMMIVGGQFFSIGLLGEMFTYALSRFAPQEPIACEVLESVSKKPNAGKEKPAPADGEG